MREDYDTHKYDQPITGYMDVMVMGVSGYDEIATHPSDGVTEGAALIGKRVLYWNDQGFVWSEKHKDTRQASLSFDEVVAKYDWIVVQWQRKCKHERQSGSECSHCKAPLQGDKVGQSVKVWNKGGVAWRVVWHDELNDRVGVHMVGDDRIEVYEEEELEELDEDEFCGSCGQIGCTW